MLNNLSKRLKDRKGTAFSPYTHDSSSLNSMQVRLNVRGGSDQWTRMRQDKLKSLKKALLYSYQSAVVQKYDVKKDSLANSLITILTFLQDKLELSENQLNILKKIEEEYEITIDRDTVEYQDKIQEIIDSLVNENPLFRCLINHDKLKVDYQDKIISIPFEEAPVDKDEIVETGFHNGTVFKWIHGNKEEWTPDTYWIVYMQYSEETAYFRAEIRKADEQIEIIVIDEEGNESSVKYRGWMTGPNETSILWNTKKGIVWNDMNYTKILYITKDQDTLAFFQRFDRIIINGKPWEVQAYNESYSVSKTAQYESGIIRVALKQTYTSTDQFIKEKLAEGAGLDEEQTILDPYIEGPTSAKPYDIVTFSAKNFNTQGEWSISDPSLAKIVDRSEDNKIITVEIITKRSNLKGFDVNYGNNDETIHNVVIKSIV